MSDKTNFIVFEGMDNCGKSTLLKNALYRFGSFKELRFPKTLPSGALLRINTEKDFEVLFTVFESLDPRKTYLLDRFILSNLVYDQVLRHEDTSLSLHYWNEFNERFAVTTIILTRPHIRSNFIDDRIKMTQQQFNDALDAYKLFGPNYQLLNRDANDQPTEVRSHEHQQIGELIYKASGWTD